jgi:hypothetical protein
MTVISLNSTTGWTSIIGGTDEEERRQFFVDLKTGCGGVSVSSGGWLTDPWRNAVLMAGWGPTKDASL